MTRSEHIPTRNGVRFEELVLMNSSRPAALKLKGNLRNHVKNGSVKTNTVGS